MTGKAVDFLHQVVEKIEDLRHMVLVIHGVIEVSTKIFEGFASFNRWNMLLFSY